MNSSVKKPDRSLLVIVAIIALLVIVALVVVFSRGEPPLRDASTPEGVVQRYSAAVIAGDETTAFGYLTDAASENCEDYPRTDTEDIRVTLVSTTERDNSADVRVSIVTSYESAPFGRDEFEAEEVFDLELVDDEWLIDTAPWQLAICQKF